MDGFTFTLYTHKTRTSICRMRPSLVVSLACERETPVLIRFTTLRSRLDHNATTPALVRTALTYTSGWYRERSIPLSNDIISIVCPPEPRITRVLHDTNHTHGNAVALWDCQTHMGHRGQAENLHVFPDGLAISPRETARRQ